MQIKRFKAKTVPEGLKRVKKELGPDAVILSTHQLKGKAGKDGVEIVAAIERDIPGRNESIRQGSLEHSNIKQQLTEIRETLSLIFSSKRFLYQLGPDRELCNLYTSLVLQGLKETYAWELLQAYAQKIEPEKTSGTEQQIMNRLVETLKTRIKTVDPFYKNGNSEPLFYSFVGPTGSGKTTTLAKLAAHLKLNRSQKVSLISLDTYRIGAIEQLKIYAQILKVPLRVASNIKEITEAIVDFTELGTDYILIDTIGKNFLVKEHVTDMKKIFDVFPQIQHFLVLPANAKDSDLTNVIRTFKDMPVHSFLFTKIDETTTHGNIINQILRFRKPVCFLGTGQRVPEDIEKADEEKLCHLLLKDLV